MPARSRVGLAPVRRLRSTKASTSRADAWLEPAGWSLAEISTTAPLAPGRRRSHTCRHRKSRCEAISPTTRRAWRDRTSFRQGSSARRAAHTTPRRSISTTASSSKNGDRWMPTIPGEGPCRSIVALPHRSISQPVLHAIATSRSTSRIVGGPLKGSPPVSVSGSTG